MPGQSVFYFRWTKLGWDRLLSQYFGFPPVSIITPVLRTHLFIIRTTKLTMFLVGYLYSIITMTISTFFNPQEIFINMLE
jgi:hypothetical protein